MDLFSIQTESNGIVEITHSWSGRYGKKLYLHIDQNANINNGEGDAAILLTNQECKEIIGIMNLYLREDEGVDYVVLLSELLKEGTASVVDSIDQP